MIIIQAVLYICHGSRVKAAANEAINFVKETMQLVDAPIQEYCFLELAKPSIHEGVENCVKRGATKIAVVPVLLLTAAHAKRDIPHELQRVMDNYSGVTYSYGKPLGVHDAMIDVLLDRIQESTEVDFNTSVVLVGRGSSDQDAIDDTQEIASRLQKKLGVSKVDICFLAAAKPSFNELIKETVYAGVKKTVILPYLLFTGILMTDIEREVEKLKLEEGQEIVICNYLGSHRNVKELLKTRVEEAIQEGDTYATMA